MDQSFTLLVMAADFEGKVFAQVRARAIIASEVPGVLLKEGGHKREQLCNESQTAVGFQEENLH